MYVARVIRAIAELMLIMGICLGAAACSQGGDGAFHLRFTWQEGVKPDYSQRTLYAWAELLEWQTDTPFTEAITLSETLPVRLGEQSTLQFDNLPFGENRVVMARIRGSDDPENTVLYYGVSSRFSLQAGDDLDVTIEVELGPAPGIGTDGRPVNLDPWVLRDGLPTIRTSTAEVGLSFMVPHAEFATVANDPAFFLGVQTRPANELVGSGERREWPVPWDLNDGFPEDLSDGTRSVFVQLSNRFGLQSEVFQTTVALDVSPPVINLDINGDFFIADDPIWITVNSNETLPADRPPVVTVSGGPEDIVPEPAFQAGLSYTYTFFGRDFLPDVPYSVTATAVDLAGNQCDPVAPKTFTVDSHEPGLAAAPEVISPSPTTEGEYWAVTGDTVQIRFTPDEPLNFGQTKISLSGEPMEYVPGDPDDPADDLWRITLDGTEGSGPKVIQGRLHDLAGNSNSFEKALMDLGEPSPVIWFDFDGPRVTGVNLIREPYFAPALDTENETTYFSDSHPIRVEPVIARVLIYADEELSGTPVITATGPGTMEVELENATSQTATAEFNFSTGARPTPGTYTLNVTWEDWLGNQATWNLDSPFLVVDDTPPAVSELDEDLVLYVRQPWGTADNGCLPLYSLEGPAGSVDPATTTSKMVTAYIDGSAEQGSQIGWAPIQPNGSFAISNLLSGNVPVVWLSLVDRAGLKSDPIEVTHIEWTASMCRKEAGSTIENPNVFEKRAWFTGALNQFGVSEADEDDGLGDTGSGLVQEHGSGSWFEQDTDKPWEDLHPPPTQAFASAYDSARGVTVMQGGMGGFIDTWEWDGQNWQIIYPLDYDGDGNPGSKNSHAAAYDSKRGVTVVFGGLPPSDQTWEWDGVNWTLRNPDDPENDGNPPELADHAMAYDSNRGVTVMFGGQSYSVLQNETWEWDGNSWVLRIPEDPEMDGNPTVMIRHAMAYDSQRGVTVLVAGADDFDGTNIGETWEWDGTSWALRMPADPTGVSSPLPRFSHNLAFDDHRGVTVLFGGSETDSGDTLDDLWDWNGITWTRIAPGTGDLWPPSRRAHGMVFDRSRGEVLLMGGLSREGASMTLNDTWRWNGTSWGLVARGSLDGSDQPAPRIKAGTAFDSERGVLVLYGGDLDNFNRLEDTWEWSGGDWTLVCDPGTGCVDPGPLMGHAMAFDERNQLTVLFGGNRESDGRIAETWTWDGTDWMQVSTGPPNPSEREFHAMAYDSVRGVTVLFGGRTNTDTNNAETWEWNGANWEMKDPVNAPSARKFHAMAYDRNREVVVLFGGDSMDEPTEADTWEWNGSNWVEIIPTDPEGDGNPPARLYHAMAYDPLRKTIILFGGDATDHGNFLFDTWEWNGTSWALRISADVGSHGQPSARKYPNLVSDTMLDRIILFAGNDGNERNDIWTWEGAADHAPGETLLLAFGEAAKPGEVFTIEDISVNWYACGSGRTADTNNAVTGVDLRVWDEGLWKVVASDATEPCVFSEMSWFPTDALQRDRLLFGPNQTLNFAVTPAGVNGETMEPAEISTDYAEVTVRYRRGN